MPGKVLLIDNNAPRRISLRSRLILSFYEVVVTPEPRVALRTIADQSVDIVLIAADLDGTCGYQLCSTIKSAYCDKFLPILILGGNTPTNWATARANQVDDVLPADYDARALMQRLRQLYRAKADFDALQLHFDANEMLGLAETPEDFQHTTTRNSQIAIVTKDIDFTDEFSTELSGKLDVTFCVHDLDDYQNISPESAMIVLLDSGRMTDHHLRILSNIQCSAAHKAIPTICLCGPSAPNFWARAVEFGAVDCMESSFPIDRIAVRIAATLRTERMTNRLRSTMSSRIKEAVTDPLTGVYNRRYCERYLRRALSADDAEQHNLVLMMIDVDNFKALNDAFGHPTGDRILKTVGELLQNNMRASDMIARVGGDEFMVVLPNIPNHTAKLLAERVRRLVYSHCTLDADPQGATRPTISIGLAASNCQPTDMMALWSAADAALYLAKRQGRNKIEFTNIAA